MPATLHRGVHRMRRVTEEDMSLKSMTLEETMEIVGMAATGAPHHRAAASKVPSRRSQGIRRC